MVPGNPLREHNHRMDNAIKPELDQNGDRDRFRDNGPPISMAAFSLRLMYVSGRVLAVLSSCVTHRRHLTLHLQGKLVVQNSRKRHRFMAAFH